MQQSNDVRPRDRGGGGEWLHKQFAAIRIDQPTQNQLQQNPPWLTVFCVCGAPGAARGGPEARHLLPDRAAAGESVFYLHFVFS